MWGEQLESAVGDATVLVQESGMWDASFDFVKWSCIKTTSFCEAAILVPVKFLPAVRWTSESVIFDSFEFATGAIVSDLGMVSAYVVHKGISNERIFARHT